MENKPERLTYKQQLQTPEWKEKAMQIKKENGWKCQHCGKAQGNVDLTVHHTYYLSHQPMWKHPRCLLLCLCHGCHMERAKFEEVIYINIADWMQNKSNQELSLLPFFNNPTYSA